MLSNSWVHYILYTLPVNFVPDPFEYICYPPGTVIRMFCMNLVNEPYDFLLVFILLSKNGFVVYPGPVDTQQITLAGQVYFTALVYHGNPVGNTIF